MCHGIKLTKNDLTLHSLDAIHEVVLIPKVEHISLYLTRQTLTKVEASSSTLVVNSSPCHCSLFLVHTK